MTENKDQPDAFFHSDGTLLSWETGAPMPSGWTGIAKLRDTLFFVGQDNGEKSYTALQAKSMADARLEVAERKLITEFLVVDGVDEAGCLAGDGNRAPFVVFSVDRQRSIAGPFASRALADQHRQEILDGQPPRFDALALSDALSAVETGAEFPPIPVIVGWKYEFYAEMQQAEMPEHARMRNYTGQTVIVVSGPLPRDDDDEISDLFKIRAADGREFEVFEEELNGWNKARGQYFWPDGAYGPDRSAAYLGNETRQSNAMAEASPAAQKNGTKPDVDLSYQYQLLGRLQQDCEYYLGFGGRAKSRLWAGDEVAQIRQMKELYAGLSEKPEWITLEAIERYEAAMVLGNAEGEEPSGIFSAAPNESSAQRDVSGSIDPDAGSLKLALEKLLPHVLHYASMPRAHADAHRDAADARHALAIHAKSARNEETVLAGLDDQALINELQRRGGLVTVWSPDDFEFIGNEDSAADALTDEELAQVQQKAFVACSRALEDVTVARGNEFLQDWWDRNRDSVLPRERERSRDGLTPGA